MLSRLSELIVATGLALCTLILAAPVCSGQDRDRDWDRDRGMYTRLEPGAMIPIRTNQSIDVDRSDNRVYYGTVDQDVRGDNGHLAIPRGATAELMVRVRPDNDLVVDLESVIVNGQRYAVRSEPNRFEPRSNDNLIGQIVGAISGVQVRGPAVRVPRDTVLSFQLNRPLEMGVADRGVERNGYHYHDWYDQRNDRQ